MSGSSPTLATRWNRVPRFARFLMVGGLNAAFGYSAYACLLFVGFHYATAALLATIMGVCFNFMSTGSLVFADRSPRAVLRFVAVYGVIYVINVALLTLLGQAGVGPYVAGLLCIVPMAALSYVLMQRFVFGGDRAAD